MTFLFLDPYILSIVFFLVWNIFLSIDCSVFGAIFSFNISLFLEACLLLVNSSVFHVMFTFSWRHVSYQFTALFLWIYLLSVEANVSFQLTALLLETVSIQFTTYLLTTDYVFIQLTAQLLESCFISVYFSLVGAMFSFNWLVSRWNHVSLQTVSCWSDVSIQLTPRLLEICFLSIDSSVVWVMFTVNWSQVSC